MFDVMRVVRSGEILYWYVSLPPSADLEDYMVVAGPSRRRAVMSCSAFRGMLHIRQRLRQRVHQRRSAAIVRDSRVVDERGLYNIIIGYAYPLAPPV